MCNADPQSTNTGKCCFFTVHVKMCSKSSSVYIQYKQWLNKVPQSLCSINTKYITDNGLIWLFILGTIVAVLMLLILLAGVVVVFYLRRKHQLCFKDEQSKYAMNREVISLILSFHRTLVVLQWNSMLTLFYYYYFFCIFKTFVTEYACIFPYRKSFTWMVCFLEITIWYVCMFFF